MRRLLTSFLTLVLASGASAQVVNYTTVEAVIGKPTRINYHGSANRDCTPDPPPTVRVIDPPRWGVLTVLKGDLTTNVLSNCPGLKVPAQIVFYAARSGATGRDHVSYEVTTASGKVMTYDVTIEIKHDAPNGERRI